MNRIHRTAAAALSALLLSFVPAGCGGDDEGGGGSADVGDNDAGLVACVGDSITEGDNCEGAPYPARLAAMCGKRVANYGVGGAESSYGAAEIGSVLSRRPGFVCILFGANDCIMGRPVETTVQNLRRIVQACKNTGSRAIVATPTPMVGIHEKFNDAVDRLVPAVKAMAKEEGVPCIDLNAAFGSGAGLLGPDGLHMTEAGSDLIAKKFNSRL